jgi:hypothetical protein
MILPNGLGGYACIADLIGDRSGVPWLAHAEPVHLADLHIGNHLRWRHGIRAMSVSGLIPLRQGNSASIA